MLFLYDLRSPFFNRLQMLLDNTGDDSDRHATVFINVRHGKRNIVFLAGRAPVEAGVSNGVGSVIQSDILNRLFSSFSSQWVSSR